MANFTSFSALRAACLDLPSGHPAASAAVAQREATLTKPPRSLGRLEDLVAWLAHWQGHAPRLDGVEILVFAGNHGVTRQGVSAYPAEVTAQMVANFAAGGAFYTSDTLGAIGSSVFSSNVAATANSEARLQCGLLEGLACAKSLPFQQATRCFRHI